jgi:hypothetical protein
VQLESEGRILTRNWELYDGQHAVFQPAQMTTEELERGTEKAWKFAYRWTSIARRLRYSPGSPLLALATNLGYRYYAHRLHKFYTCDAMFAPGLPVLSGLGKPRGSCARPEPDAPLEELATVEAGR